jgi:general secretion pathway protein I
MQRGFTLLEVLVALFVAAVALTAAGKAVSMAVDGETASRQHVLALWVAENRLAELQSAPGVPTVGTQEGGASEAGLDLHWRVEVSATPNARFRLARVSVSLPGHPGYALAQLSGYVVRK